MLNENAKKWVEALRSGKYKQGKHALKIGDSYCCLGVGCVVYEEQTGNVLPREEDGTFFESKKDRPGTLCGKLEAVRDWLGLSTNIGSYLLDDIILTDLTYKNDDGVDFLGIADIIESEPEGLFV